MAQAGPDSDVILGLGYDNTLGAEISITLIATGFEHKDPFAKTINQPKIVKKEDEKIVLNLAPPEKEVVKMQQPQTQQPTLQFDVAEVVAPTEKVILVIENDLFPQNDNSMMPTLSAPSITETLVNLPGKNTVEKSTAEPIFF